MAVQRLALPWEFLTATLLLFLSEVSRANESFIGPDTCNRPFSLDSNFSFLRWPFPSGSWTVRNNWIGANEPGGEGSGWGQGRHFGSHYYAVDWNKVGSNDCDSIFYAPMGGTVVYSYWNCWPGCVATGQSCRGNEVVIQSNVDTSYAFSVLHLNMVFVPLGRIVKAGDPLGTIGSTGFSSSAHAHCVLFKKINRNLSGTTIGLQFPDEHAARFDFSAECGGDGPHNITFDTTTTTDTLPPIVTERYFQVIYQPGSRSIVINPLNDPMKKYNVVLFSYTGQRIMQQNLQGRGSLSFDGSLRGIHFIVIRSGKERIVKKIFISVH